MQKPCKKAFACLSLPLLLSVLTGCGGSENQEVHEENPSVFDASRMSVIRQANGYVELVYRFTDDPAPFEVPEEGTPEWFRFIEGGAEYEWERWRSQYDTGLTMAYFDKTVSYERRAFDNCYHFILFEDLRENAADPTQPYLYYGYSNGIEVGIGAETKIDLSFYFEPSYYEETVGKKTIEHHVDASPTATYSLTLYPRMEDPCFSNLYSVNYPIHKVIQNLENAGGYEDVFIETDGVSDDGFENLKANKLMLPAMDLAPAKAPDSRHFQYELWARRPTRYERLERVNDTHVKYRVYLTHERVVGNIYDPKMVQYRTVSGKSIEEEGTIDIPYVQRPGSGFAYLEYIIQPGYIGDRILNAYTLEEGVYKPYDPYTFREELDALGGEAEANCIFRFPWSGSESNRYLPSEGSRQWVDEKQVSWMDSSDI